MASSYSYRLAVAVPSELAPSTRISAGLKVGSFLYSMRAIDLRILQIVVVVASAGLCFDCLDCVGSGGQAGCVPLQEKRSAKQRKHLKQRRGGEVRRKTRPTTPIRDLLFQGRGGGGPRPREGLASWSRGPPAGCPLSGPPPAHLPASYLLCFFFEIFFTCCVFFDKKVTCCVTR